MSKKFVSKPSRPVLDRPVLVFAAEPGLDEEVEVVAAGGEAMVRGAPIRTLMQCVGLLLSLQMNLIASSHPGIGVTISGGV